MCIFFNIEGKFVNLEPQWQTFQICDLHFFYVSDILVNKFVSNFIK